MLNPYRAYQETEINTASKGKLVVMLYGGVQKFMAEAKAAIADGNIEASHNAIMRAQDIITELRSDLNMEAGGELAANLDNLYEYIEYRLMMGNARKDAAELDLALNVVNTLKEAWIAISVPSRTTQAPPMGLQSQSAAV